MSKKGINSLKSGAKNSIVIGGLIGTTGLFVAKFLGLFYSIPLSSILGSDALMSYYGTAYLVYSYILNVFTAGVPFAICTIVAKYTALEDNRSLCSIKKISNQLMKLLGIAGMLLMIILSGFMAPLITEGDGVWIMATCLRLLAIAIFFVPILSGYRGFWQGRKEMEEYAFSQTFEQIFHVGFLLTSAYLIVYVLHLDRTYALYAAVISTSVAAIAGIIQIYYFDKKNYREINEAALHQESDAVKSEQLFRELISLAIPYLLSAIIGYCDDIYNSILLPVGLRLHGYNAEDLSIILSAINYVGYKLTSIPQILSPGFAAALIPHVTEALLAKDYKRVGNVIVECIGIVIFIGSMLSAMIAIYATDIYHLLFYTSNISLSADVVRWIAIEGFLGTICPVSSSLMIASGLKKSVLKRTVIHAVIKGSLIIPLIILLGYPGAVISSVVGNVYFFTGNIREMNQEFKIGMTNLLSVAWKIALAILSMAGVSYILRIAGISGESGTTVIAFVRLAINAICSMSVFFITAEALKIPYDLFHKSIFSVLKSRIKKSSS